MRKSYLIVLAATALVGCSKSEITIVDSDNVKIAVNASEIATRAPFEGTISIANQLKARVIADNMQNFVGESTANGTMTFNSIDAVSYDIETTDGTTYFSGASPVYLFGLYPEGWTYLNDGKANFTFTGKEDVMATNRIETRRTDVESSNYKTLDFQHLLTKLEVKLFASAAAINLFGNIKAIKLVGNISGGGNVTNQIEVANNSSAYTDPLVVASKGTTASLDFYGLSLDVLDDNKLYTDVAVSDYTLTTIRDYVGYSMVAPVNATAAANEYFLAITTANKGIKYIGIDLKAVGGSDFTGNTAGHSFLISIHFKSNNDIMVDVTVDDWDEQGEFQGEIAD
ncbi:MAG: fimbrillin family protein [Mediterranea sp.]|jgi:hypothetical protein|nr:fimbrillin family protein [Mediterranea sp.]